MTSLYHALKSAARVVSAFVSAIPPLSSLRPTLTRETRQLRGRRAGGHGALSRPARAEILDHHFAPGAIVRPDHHGPRRAARVRQLELPAQRHGAERVLGAEARRAELVRQ